MSPAAPEPTLPDTGGGLAPGARRWMHHGRNELVEDLVSLSLPEGARVVVVSDLHLSGSVTAAATRATEELVEVLRSWSEPGVFVIAGDGFEQLHEPVAPIDRILDAHDAFVTAIADFADAEDHEVVVLSGNHDGNIAWDADVAATLQRRLGGARLGLELDIELGTAEGPRTVHVVHGNQWDPYNAFVDRRSPIDSPTGHHVVREVLPRLGRASQPGGLLDGLDSLAEVPLVGEMVGSRLLYRRIGRHAWVLLVPLVVLALARVVRQVVPSWTEPESTFESWVLRATLLAVGALAIAVAATVVTLVGVHRSLAHGAGTGRESHNDRARAHARHLAAEGVAGLVTGHTHHPELTSVGDDAFYANCGCGVDVTGPSRSRLRLPRVFATVRRVSHLEITGADRVRARLVVGDELVPSPSRFERLVVRRDATAPPTPAVVATFPGDGGDPATRYIAEP